MTGRLGASRRAGAMLIVLAALAPAASDPPETRAAPAPALRGTVWVANEGSDGLAAIDAATNEVVVMLKGVLSPHNVQVAPGGRTVWAVSGAASLAVAVDARSYRLRGFVRTGAGPAHVVVTPDGRTVYVSNSADDTVTAIDARRMRVIATIPVGDYPHGLRPSPDGRFVYVANVEGGSVSVISTRTNRAVAEIPVGSRPVQVAFAPDGRTVYVSLAGEDAVARIDVRSRRVTGRTAVRGGPIQLYVTPDGRMLVVANQGTEERPSTTLTLVSTATFRRVADVETGSGPHGVVVDPASARAYVTNLYGGNLAVVDLGAGRVAARVRVGKEPNGVSFSPLPPPKPARAVLYLPVPRTGGPMSH